MIITSQQSELNLSSDPISGTLLVPNGGTGITSNPSMLIDLSSTAAASVFSTNPRPGVTNTLPVARGGTGVTSLSALASALAAYSSGAKILRGSYTGTGTYGSSNPCSLTFDFVPKALIILSDVGSNYRYGPALGVWVYSGNSMPIFFPWAEQSYVPTTEGVYALAEYSVSKRAITWAAVFQDAAGQLNVNGLAYHWVAFG